MEQRSIGDGVAAQNVDQRSVRESFTLGDDEVKLLENAEEMDVPDLEQVLHNCESPSSSATKKPKNKKEVEVFQWENTGGEVWMNDRAIESKMPQKKQQQQQQQRGRSNRKP